MAVSVSRAGRVCRAACLAGLLAGAVGALPAQPAAPTIPGASGASGTVAPPASAASARSSALRAALEPLLQRVPLVLDRLRPADLGLVINRRDPYSVAVGAYYAARRGLRPSQVLTVDLPVQPVLGAAEFDALSQAIDQHFGSRAQALALAWVQPYAVGCSSITGALALGHDEALCRDTCAPTRRSPYANSASARPYTDFRMRLSMLLAAPDVAQAQALIDRGLRADASLGAAGTPPARAAYVSTADPARNVRSLLYPGVPAVAGGAVQVQRAAGWGAVGTERLLLLSIGASQVEPMPPASAWLPGALADHLTSMGGDLAGGHGQTAALAWIAAGATASHGTVSEPCNHLQKFPHPSWLLGHYVQGATAVEAYWKSVLWPQQSLFIGEPLAAPFAPSSPSTPSTPSASSTPPAAPTAPTPQPSQADRPAPAASR